MVNEVHKNLWTIENLGSLFEWDNMSPSGDSPPDVIEILVISSMTTGGHRFRVALYFSSKKKESSPFHNLYAQML